MDIIFDNLISLAYMRNRVQKLIAQTAKRQLYDRRIEKMRSFRKKRPGKIELKKDDTPKQNQVLIDDYVYRYPSFPRGIPATPIETITAT